MAGTPEPGKNAVKLIRASLDQITSDVIKKQQRDNETRRALKEQEDKFFAELEKVGEDIKIDMSEPEEMELVTNRVDPLKKIADFLKKDVRPGSVTEKDDVLQALALNPDKIQLGVSEKRKTALQEVMNDALHTSKQTAITKLIHALKQNAPVKET